MTRVEHYQTIAVYAIYDALMLRMGVRVRHVWPLSISEILRGY